MNSPSSSRIRVDYPLRENGFDSIRFVSLAVVVNPLSGNWSGISILKLIEEELSCIPMVFLLDESIGAEALRNGKYREQYLDKFCKDQSLGQLNGSTNGKTKIKRPCVVYRIFCRNQPGYTFSTFETIEDCRFDYVCVVGGDGTANEAVNGCIRYCEKGNWPKIIFFPSGTGNDYLKSLPQNFQVKSGEDIIKMIVSGKWENVHIGKIVDAEGEVRHFLNVCSVGLSIDILLKMNHQAMFKNISYYIWSFFIYLFSKKYYQGKIVINRKKENPSGDGNVTVVNADFRVVGIGLGKFFGNGIMICPRADPLSGVLNVVVLRTNTFTNRFRQIISFVCGWPLEEGTYSEYFTDSITIIPETSNKPFYECDGILGTQIPIEITIQKSALSLACKD